MVLIPAMVLINLSLGNDSRLRVWSLAVAVGQRMILVAGGSRMTLFLQGGVSSPGPPQS